MSLPKGTGPRLPPSLQLRRDRSRLVRSPLATIYYPKRKRFGYKPHPQPNAFAFGSIATRDNLLPKAEALRLQAMSVAERLRVWFDRYPRQLTIQSGSASSFAKATADRSATSHVRSRTPPRLVRSLPATTDYPKRKRFGYRPGPLLQQNSLRNWVGASPVIRLKERLNWEIESKPVSKAISLTRRWGFCRRFLAFSTRTRER